MLSRLLVKLALIFEAVRTCRFDLAGGLLAQITNENQTHGALVVKRQDACLVDFQMFNFPLILNHRPSVVLRVISIPCNSSSLQTAMCSEDV